MPPSRLPENIEPSQGAKQLATSDWPMWPSSQSCPPCQWPAAGGSRGRGEAEAPTSQNCLCPPRPKAAQMGGHVVVACAPPLHHWQPDAGGGSRAGGHTSQSSQAAGKEEHRPLPHAPLPQLCWLRLGQCPPKAPTPAAQPSLTACLARSNYWKLGIACHLCVWGGGKDGDPKSSLGCWGTAT